MLRLLQRALLTQDRESIDSSIAPKKLNVDNLFLATRLKNQLLHADDLLLVLKDVLLQVDDLLLVLIQVLLQGDDLLLKKVLLVVKDEVSRSKNVVKDEVRFPHNGLRPKNKVEPLADARAINKAEQVLLRKYPELLVHLPFRYQKMDIIGLPGRMQNTSSP